MLKILLVNDTRKQVGRLRGALVEAGFDVVDEVSSALMIPRKVAGLQPDLVMIDTESPSRDVLEQIVVVSDDELDPLTAGEARCFMCADPRVAGQDVPGPPRDFIS